MFFKDDFIENILSEPISSVHEITERLLRHYVDLGGGQGIPNGYEEYLEGYALLQSIFNNTNVESNVKKVNFDGEKDTDCKNLLNYFSQIRKEYATLSTNLKLETLSKKFTDKLGAGFIYEFTQGDIDRIQTLINELRGEISNSELFSEEHRNRLLRRLEKMQSEVHKKMSDIDRFWGLVGDAGVVMGKFGKDSKPIVDRIKELAEIVWRTQSKAEELPSGTNNPMLPHVDEDKNCQ